jgi:hypothetical protein
LVCPFPFFAQADFQAILLSGYFLRHTYDEMADQISRRELLRTAALGSIGLGLGSSANALTLEESEQTLENLIVGPPQKAKSMIGVPSERRDTARLAFIGTGLRGRSVIDEFVNVPNVKIVAVNDTVKEKAEKAKVIVEKAGQPVPAVYVDGDYGYRELLKRDDIDLVYIATPWEWHVPQAIDAMKAGKHAATAVAKGSAPVKFPDFTRGGWQNSRDSIPVEKKVGAAA